MCFPSRFISSHFLTVLQDFVKYQRSSRCTDLRVKSKELHFRKNYCFPWLVKISPFKWNFKGAEIIACLIKTDIVNRNSMKYAGVFYGANNGAAWLRKQVIFSCFCV